MRRTRKNKQIKISSKVIIMLAIITTIIATALSMSKYQEVFNGSANGKVAVPIVTVTSDTLDLKLDPVDNEQDYIFKVSNYDEKLQTEVSMQYNLQIKNLNNLPLDFELYKYDAENETKLGENLLTGNITENRQLDINEQVEHTYLLKIKWRETEKSHLFSKEIDYVQIILNSSQID